MCCLTLCCRKSRRKNDFTTLHPRAGCSVAGGAGTGQGCASVAFSSRGVTMGCPECGHCQRTESLGSPQFLDMMNPTRPAKENGSCSSGRTGERLLRLQGGGAFPSLGMPEDTDRWMCRRWMGKRHVQYGACVLALPVVILALVVALAVVAGVYSRSRVLHPDFSEVCPDAWLGFQGKCYYFSEAEGNWTSSQESCKALGATLAFISSLEELDFIRRYKGKANHWLGLEKKDDGWWWSNGTVLGDWLEVRGSGPCAYINEEKISSSLCHTRKNWLCSKPDSYVLWRKKAYPSKNSL